MLEEDFFAPLKGVLSLFQNIWISNEKRISYIERVELFVSRMKENNYKFTLTHAIKMNEWMNLFTNKNLPCAIWKSIVWAANHHETISISVKMALNKLFMLFYGIYKVEQMGWEAESEQVGDDPIKWTMYAYRNIDRKMIDEYRWWFGCPYMKKEEMFH